MSRNSYIIHDDFYYQIEYLPNEVKGSLWNCIFRYRLFGEIPCKDEYLIYSLFMQFKNQFDRDNEKYEKQCERNRSNGVKGGRPKTTVVLEKPSGLTNNPEKPIGLFENPTQKVGYEKNQENPIMNSDQCIMINGQCSINSVNEYNDISELKIPPQQKQTIDIRKMEFQKQCSEANAVRSPERQLSRGELQKFYAYWSESKTNGKKFRMEMEKVFDIQRRMDTWLEKSYNKQNNLFNGTNQTSFREEQNMAIGERMQRAYDIATTVYLEEQQKRNTGS